MEILIDVLSVVLSSTLISGMVVQIMKRREDQGAKDDYSQALMLGLTQAFLIREVARHKERGYIEPHELAVLTNSLYAPYLAMGGNGYAQKAVDELKSLPSLDEWLRTRAG